MPSLLQQLKDRKLVQWALAYLGGAWLLLQIVGLFAEQLDWSAQLFRVTLILLAVGFPAALVLAWYHGEKGRQRVGGIELLMLGALLIIAGAALTLVRRGGGPATAREPTAEGPGRSAPVAEAGSRAAALRSSRLTAARGLEERPDWSPDRSSIAYVSDQTGNRDLWIRALARGEELQITDDPGDDTQPAWSPDGRRIAFTSSRDHGPRLDQSVQFGYSLGGGIWIVPALGGSPTRVIDDGFNPSWSPDGLRLAFDSSRDGPRRIWTVGSEGANPVRVSTDRSDGAVHTRPAWSPDGRWIAYERQEGSLTTSSDIHLVPAAGGTSVPVLADGKRNLAPAWAEAGTLVFVSDRSGALNLWRLQIDPSTGAPVGGPEQLTTSAGNDVDPSVSPDGNAIVYSSTRSFEDLWSVELDSVSGQAVGEPRPLLASSWNDVAPAVSPDGTKLVIASDRGGGPQKLWQFEVGTQSPSRITDGPGRDMQPDWSSDGRRIAFFSDRSGNDDLWVVPAGGGAAIQLTTDPAADMNPFWSPDGRQIAFMSDRSGSMEVWVMDIDGSNARRLTDVGATAHTARWSPTGEWILFTSMKDGNRDIWAVSPLDGTQRQLTNEPTQNAHGLWSADGTRVLYLADHRVLRAVGLEGGPSSLLFDPGEGRRIDYTHLSGDGRVLYFTVQQVEGDLWRLEGLDGS